MDQYLKKSLMFMLSFIAMVGIMIGCAQKQRQIQVSEYTPMSQPCDIPDGYLVDDAFSQAKSTLSNRECASRFDEIFTALLKIAEGAPDPSHKEKFYNLLEWAKTEGIISKVTAQEYYTRHFHHMFYSLPREYQTCSYCPKLPEIMSDLKSELRQKAQGLNIICNDKASYAKAANDLQSLEIILEATCKACESQE